MSFWWVNHKQTANAEIGEGYIWSPQTNKDGSRNEAYLNLKRVKPGETIFSYAGGVIPAVGKIIAPAEDEPKPPAFGSAGDRWGKKGWMVRVKWVRLDNPLRPKDYLNDIVPLLPDKYSPLQTNGNGNQKLYLSKIDTKLGQLLLCLLSNADYDFTEDLKNIEDELAESKEVENIIHSNLSTTQREQLIQARIGQGAFRMHVESIESKCRVTGLTDKRFLVASHIKPWRKSDNLERLDGHNGFLISPHVDKLFDRGWISFSSKGRMLMASKNIRPILSIWAIDPLKQLGNFTKRQKTNLEFHRDEVLKK
jgi:putative restriction endonuclease